MSYTPAIIGSGNAGFAFLKATEERQRAAHQQSVEVSRKTEYFKDKIASVGSARELVADRRLLEVALGAFGLSDDINNRFFIERILSEGSSNSDALASRLSDKRYLDLAKAFGLGPGDVVRTKSEGFADSIISKFEASSFEQNVGEQSPALRIALFAERVMPEIAESGLGEDGKWFTILGQPPLREFVQVAFGLPQSFSQIDLDKQLDTIKNKASRLFGASTVAALIEPDVFAKVTARYLAMDQLAQFAQTGSSGSIALQLLRGR